jgi:vacuolar protein sorting-associated protein 45
MVLIPLVRDYIDRMLHDVSGMKVLVLDPQTVRASPQNPSPGSLRSSAGDPIYLTRSAGSFQVEMVSVVYSQSDLLRKEVFLVETVDDASSSRASMAHLKAVFFFRPSSDNIQKLRRHLAAPRFAECHLCPYLISHLLQ